MIITWEDFLLLGEKVALLHTYELTNNKWRKETGGDAWKVWEWVALLLEYLRRPSETVSLSPLCGFNQQQPTTKKAGPPSYWEVCVRTPVLCVLCCLLYTPPIGKLLPVFSSVQQLATLVCVFTLSISPGI